MDEDKSFDANQATHTVVIEDLQKLKQWLTANEIDFSLWGSGSAKTVEHLWQELVEGETYLQAHPPTRVCAVVQVIIQQGDKILIEAEQLFANGQRRNRDSLPSEKMKLDEPYDTAAVRCLAEELSLDPKSIDILHSTYRVEVELVESPSYPGLQTQYLLHKVGANVPSLPAEEFWTTENLSSEASDMIMRHRWVWRDSSQ